MDVLVAGRQGTLSIQFTAEDKHALDHGRFNYPDPHIQRRMEVLWLVSQGLGRSEVACLAGVSTKTVRRYIKRYKRGGIEALKQSLYHGRKSELEPHIQSLKEEYFETTARFQARMSHHSGFPIRQKDKPKHGQY